MEIDFAGTMMECGCLKDIIVLYFLCATCFVILYQLTKHYFPSDGSRDSKKV